MTEKQKIKKQKIIFACCMFVLFNISYGVCEKIFVGSYFPTIEFVETYPQIVNDAFGMMRSIDLYPPDIAYSAVYLHTGKQIFIISPSKRYKLVAHELCHWFGHTYHLPKDIHRFIDDKLWVDTSSQFQMFVFKN